MNLPSLDYPRVVLVVVLFAINLGIVLAVTTSGTPYGPYNDDWDGTSSFRQTVGGDAQVTLAHETGAYERGSPGEAVAIVMAPEEQYGRTDSARVRQFVSRGGTLVVLSADPQRNDLLEALEMQSRLDGRLVRDETQNYLDGALPVATPASASSLTDDVQGVTLNYATVINTTAPAEQTTEKEVTPILNSSVASYLDEDRDGELDETEPVGSRPVAVVERVGEGRVVLVGDEDVFTNAMIQRSDNRQFARNLADGHDVVVIDYSHGGPLPPLVYGLLVVRQTPLLQVVLGLVAFGGLLAWYASPQVSIPGRRDTDGRPGGPPDVELDGDDLSAYLGTEYPDWDDTQVDRVTKAIIRSRRQGEGNE